MKGGLLTETPSAMTSLLSDLGTVGTSVLDTVSDVAGVIVAQPLLLLTVGLAVSCLGVEYRGAPAINFSLAGAPLSVFEVFL